jgi:ribonucleotide reductase alpha subunit
MILRINEAIARAERNGKKILKKELAAKIWTNSRPEAQAVNMTNLCTGVTQKINPEWIIVICKETGCSADFLLGIKEDDK